MKLLRYGEPGLEKPGILDGEGKIRDLSGHVPDVNGEVLTPEGLNKLRQINIRQLSRVEGEVRYGPCVANVGKFLCIGLNYADHARESGMAIPDFPELFTKATSAICGPNDNTIKPRDSTKLDWEVELGLVIGSHSAYVPEENAMEHIAGYCVVNDVSERAFQFDYGTQWDKGKGCDTFGPIGPWLVTRDDIDDVLDLKMWLDVNGKRFQDGNTRTMIFDPAFIVSYLSRFMSLQPGDVISTGTPPGVGLGQKPPVYLGVGDIITLGIDGLGEQTQTVIPCPVNSR